jgi:hypothetical protein
MRRTLGFLFLGCPVCGYEPTSKMSYAPAGPSEDDEPPFDRALLLSEGYTQVYMIRKPSVSNLGTTTRDGESVDR